MVAIEESIVVLGILAILIIIQQGWKYLLRWWYARWNEIERVPNWVWKTYSIQPHHAGLSYTYSGKRYQYRIVVGDEMNPDKFFKRKKRARGGNAVSKKIIIVFVLLLAGGYYLLEGSDILSPVTPIQTPPRKFQAKDPNEQVTLEEPSEATPASGILDFNEARRFDSIEEIGEIRFTMTVGEVYIIQQYYEYSYEGIGTQFGVTGGKIHLKDSSDPEINKGAQPLFLGQVGNPLGIGFVNVEGRHYSVTILEIQPTVLKLRIEEIKD